MDSMELGWNFPSSAWDHDDEDEDEDGGLLY